MIQKKGLSLALKSLQLQNYNSQNAMLNIAFHDSLIHLFMCVQVQGRIRPATQQIK
jgi:hypothetical protein